MANNTITNQNVSIFIARLWDAIEMFEWFLMMFSLLFFIFRCDYKTKQIDFK